MKTPDRIFSKIATRAACASKARLFAAVAVVLAYGSLTASAVVVVPSSLVFNVGTIFSSGSVAPTSAAPWLTATFQNGSSTGHVTLTMQISSSLPAGEYVDEWDFNFNPSASLNPANLNFSLLGTAPAAVPSLNKGTDVKKADGDGYYDINFNFTNSGSNGGANRFVAGETFAYDITYTGAYAPTASDFNYLSTAAGGSGPFYTAAHIAGMPNGSSAWVTIPEPSSCAAVLGLLALGVVVIRRNLCR